MTYEICGYVTDYAPWRDKDNIEPLIRETGAWVAAVLIFQIVDVSPGSTIKSTWRLDDTGSTAAFDLALLGAIIHLYCQDRFISN